MEINSFGGHLKQYEVAVDPDALYSPRYHYRRRVRGAEPQQPEHGRQLYRKENRAYYIRSEGMIHDLKDIGRIVITNRGGIPIHVSDGEPFVSVLPSVSETDYRRSG